MRRPQPTEHAEYYSTYIDRVPDGDVLAVLAEALAALASDVEFTVRAIISSSPGTRFTTGGCSSSGIWCSVPIREPQ